MRSPGLSANGRAQELRGQRCRGTARPLGPGTGAEQVAGSVRAAAETPPGRGDRGQTTGTWNHRLTDPDPSGAAGEGERAAGPGRIDLVPLDSRAGVGRTPGVYVHRGLHKGPSPPLATTVHVDGTSTDKTNWEGQAAQSKARRGGNVLFLCLWLKHEDPAEKEFYGPVCLQRGFQAVTPCLQLMQVSG